MKKIILVLLTTVLILFLFACNQSSSIKSKNNFSIKPNVIELLGEECSKVAKKYLEDVTIWYNSKDIKNPIVIMDDPLFILDFTKDSNGNYITTNIFSNYINANRESIVLIDKIESISSKIRNIDTWESEFVRIIIVDDTPYPTIIVEEKAWNELKILIEEAIFAFCG